MARQRIRRKYQDKNLDREIADLEQGNDGAAMGQAVKTAGGQGRDAVHKFQRYVGGDGHFGKFCSHGLENDAHAAGGRARNARQNANREGQ